MFYQGIKKPLSGLLIALITLFISACSPETYKSMAEMNVRNGDYDIRNIGYLQGNPDSNAENLLGTIYLHGYTDYHNLSHTNTPVVGPDYKKAFELFKSSAEKGNMYAQYNLGMMYLKGNSAVAANSSEALKLFKLSADQGYTDAQTQYQILNDRIVSQEKARQVQAEQLKKQQEENQRLAVEQAAEKQKLMASFIDIKNDPLLSRIFDAFKRKSDPNSESKFVDITGSIVKRGSVPPSALNSLVQGRLPATLACYHYIWIVEAEVETDMCVYFIENPTRGTYGVMWRGTPQELYSFMSDDGFTSEVR